MPLLNKVLDWITRSEFDLMIGLSLQSVVVADRSC